METYNKLLDKYIKEGINYSANTISKADIGDLQQLASDSYWKGWHDHEDNHIDHTPKGKLTCKNCNEWYGININHKCNNCLGDDFIIVV